MLYILVLIIKYKFMNLSNNGCMLTISGLKYAIVVSSQNQDSFDDNYNENICSCILVQLL